MTSKTKTATTPGAAWTEVDRLKADSTFDEVMAGEYMDNQEYTSRRQCLVSNKGPAGHCLCGCGSKVDRRFKPGHDARLKGALIRAYRAGEPAMHTAFAVTDPKIIAFSLGWDHFLTDIPAPRVRIKVEKAPKASKMVMAKIGRWLYEGHVEGDIFHYADRFGNPLQTTKFTLA